MRMGRSHDSVCHGPRLAVTFMLAAHQLFVDVGTYVRARQDIICTDVRRLLVFNATVGQAGADGPK